MALYIREGVKSPSKAIVKKAEVVWLRSNFGSLFCEVYLCWAHVQDGFGMQNAYFGCVVSCLCVVWLDNSVKVDFRNLIVKRGYSEKTADELWKWYDFSEKKGVASF